MALTRITTGIIADNTLAVANIADNAVDATKIAQNSILTRHIDDAQITNAHMADDAIDSAEIADGAIDTVHIADDQVTLAKMAGITRGSIIIGNSSGDPAALAIGSNDYVLTSDGTDIAWEAASSFDADAAQVFNESGAAVDFRIESDDNANMFFIDGSEDKIGIGTASPGAELHLYKSNGNPTLYFENSDTATDSGDFLGKIEFKGNDGSSNASGIRAHIHGGIQNTSGGAFLAFGVANSSTAVAESMRIQANGNVGIGTTAPGYNLVVNSTGNSILQIKSGDTSWASLYFGEQSSAYRGVIQYNNNTDHMEFYTTGSERMRILSGGGLTFNGDTATANALDDYEEGTWTPALDNGGVSSLTTYAIYTKIGRICHIHAKITAVFPSLPGQIFQISGLPYASVEASDGGQRAHIAVGGDSGSLGSLGDDNLHFRTNGSVLTGVYTDTSGNTAYMYYNYMGNTSIELNLHGHYTV